MTNTRTTRHLGAVGVALTLALGLAACGDSDGTSGTTTSLAPTAEVEIAGAWARTSPAETTKGVVYLEITNTGDLDDALIAGAVDPAVAARVELHETVVAGGNLGDETPTTGMGGEMMEMREVDQIAIPAGATVSLEPGGLHIMLIDLAAPLEAGTTVEVTLTFEEAGDEVVTAEVRDTAP